MVREVGFEMDFSGVLQLVLVEVENENFVTQLEEVTGETSADSLGGCMVQVARCQFGGQVVWS